MKRQRLFIRNNASRNLFDIFLVAAVSSILLLRFYLHITGYPSIGGTKYHIAHVVWGGVLMLIAFLLNFAFLGRAMQRVVALVSGAGFGIFIDEIGKLITRDNDYFFRPAVGIIYAVFVCIYLTISYLTREQKMTNEEYQLNALRQLEEAVHQDMDVHERASTRRLLRRANQQAILTRQLLELVDTIPVAAPKKTTYYHRQKKRWSQFYGRLAARRTTSLWVRLFFVVETLGFIMAICAAMYTNIADVQDFFSGKADYGHSLIMGQLFTTLFSIACIVAGLAQLSVSRLRAFEWFRRATLINLLLTQFFEFSRVEFAALPGFLFSLALLGVINAVLAEEIRRQI